MNRQYESLGMEIGKILGIILGVAAIIVVGVLLLGVLGVLAIVGFFVALALFLVWIISRITAWMDEL